MDRSVFELFRLDGKVAIVTGAHAWLGYDIACAFAEAGADVIITSRNVDSIRETAAQIGEKYHVDTLALPLDQRKYENVQKMADAALAWKGHIDILVNNAGGGSGKTEGDFLKRDPADIQNRIDINLTGSVFCSKAVGAMMAKAGCGKIINIASISAFLARDRRTYHLHNKMEQPVDYAAAKGGVVGYTIDLAAVMSQYGVYVNCISPGAFDKGDQPEGYSQAYRDKVPLGRMGRFGIDIKGAALLLASPASDYMTGANIVVDGGFSIWN